MATQLFNFQNGEPIPSPYAISGMDAAFGTSNVQFRSTEEWHTAQLEDSRAKSNKIRERAELTLQLVAAREKQKEIDEAAAAQRALQEANARAQQAAAAAAAAKAAAQVPVQPVSAQQPPPTSQPSQISQIPQVVQPPQVAQPQVSAQNGFPQQVHTQQQIPVQQPASTVSAAQVLANPIASQVSAPQSANASQNASTSAPPANPFRVVPPTSEAGLVQASKPQQNVSIGSSNLVANHNPFAPAPAASNGQPTRAQHGQSQSMDYQVMEIQPTATQSTKFQAAEVQATQAPTPQAQAPTAPSWDGSDPVMNPDFQNPFSAFYSSAPSHSSLGKAGSYKTIHKNLKMFRKYVQQYKPNGSTAFTRKCNDMRREIQKIVGQLTPESSQKAQCISKIMIILREARLDQTKFHDVRPFSVHDRENEVTPADVEREPYNNGPQMSMQLLYLLASFVKIIVKQWTEYGSQNGKADPVGQLTVRIFSEPEFFWRGQTLIDMLLAKIWKTCPVLFGARGDPRGPDGRNAIGWRQRDDVYIPEEEHYERMAGIAAGYASLSLRNFSNSKRLKNPFPPINFWQSLSAILLTPPVYISSTTFIVMRGLLKGNIEPFLKFYGSFARDSLKACIVDFPGQVRSANPHKKALENLADTFEQVTGWELRKGNPMILSG